MTQVASSHQTADTTVTTTTEQVALILPPISTRTPNDIIRLTGFVVVTAGASTTVVSLKFRRGTGITGTVIDEASTMAVTPAVAIPISLRVEDVPGDVNGQQYALTVQQVAATANGTINYASVVALIGD